MCMLAHLKVWNQLVAKSFYRCYALHILTVLSNESVARHPHFHPIQNSPSRSFQLQLWLAHSSASITSNYSRHWMPATISFKLYLMQYALLHYNYCYFRSDRYCYLIVILLYCTTKVLCTFYRSIMQSLAQYICPIQPQISAIRHHCIMQPQTSYIRTIQLQISPMQHHCIMQLQTWYIRTRQLQIPPMWHHWILHYWLLHTTVKNKSNCTTFQWLFHSSTQISRTLCQWLTPLKSN